jgi:hypothetical protein
MIQFNCVYWPSSDKRDFEDVAIRPKMHDAINAAGPYKIEWERRTCFRNISDISIDSVSTTFQELLARSKQSELDPTVKVYADKPNKIQFKAKEKNKDGTITEEMITFEKLTYDIFQEKLSILENYFYPESEALKSLTDDKKIQKYYLKLNTN